jgi:hypothetical protein
VFGKPITGTSATFSGRVTADGLTSLSDVTAETGSFSGLVEAGSVHAAAEVTGATGAFTGLVEAGLLESAGPISGTDGTFSGAVQITTRLTVGTAPAVAVVDPVFLAVGASTVAAGAVRIGNNQYVASEESGGGTDRLLLGLDAAGVLQLGNSVSYARFNAARHGFFGATPVARPSLGAAASDPATTQTLANALRTALINLGLAQS